MLKLHVDDEIELFLLMPYHAEAFYQLVETNRAYWNKWHTWVDGVTDTESAARFIQVGLDMLAAGTAIRYGLLYQGKLAGQIMSLPVRHQRKLEIAYQLDEASTGKGVMTRSIRAVLREGFGEMGMQKAEIWCATMNTQSRAIPERLGFQQEGIIRRGEVQRGQYNDLVIYGMLREEWKDG